MDLNVTHFLDRRSGLVQCFIGFGLFAAVVIVDYLADWEITTLVIYIFPVSYFAWHFSSRIGTLVALFSVFVWLYLNHLKAPHYLMPVVPYWNAVIHLGLNLIVVFLVSEVKSLYVQELENSRLDYLTGIINRRGFYEALGRERERASRLNLPMTVAYIDLDDFKQINDRFDHITGDNVLASIGETLRSSIRNTDLAGRLGGDEFCVLLPHTDLPGARVVLEKLRETLLNVMNASAWPVTFSIGAVTFQQPVKSPDEMIRIADGAMYAAKQQGKNRILFAVES